MEQSASKVDAKIIVFGKGELKAEVFRHLAPITVNKIINKMPIYGRISKLNDNIVCILTQILTGIEKGETKFLKGDIAFLPLNGSICIFLKESTSVRRMSLIGKVISSLETLDKCGPGDTVTLDKV